MPISNIANKYFFFRAKYINIVALIDTNQETPNTPNMGAQPDKKVSTWL